MYRKLVVYFAVLIVVGLMATTVFAGNSRFKEVDVCLDSCNTGGGKGGGPKNNLSDMTLVEFSSQAGTVIFNNFRPLAGGGTLAGLGNQDVTVIVESEGIAEGVTCTNHGGNQVPGQPRPFKATGIQFIPSDLFQKNGTTSFNVPIELPLVTPEQVGCPQDHNWSATAEFLRYDGQTTVTAIQNGTSPLQAIFNCSMPNANTLICNRIN